MISQNLQTLKRLTFKVLEETCFLLQSQEISPGDQSEVLTVHLRCGERYDLYFGFDERLTRAIAQNFLGLDHPSEDESLVVSSVKEIGNMIGGNYMNAVGLPAESRLSIPEIVGGSWSSGEVGPHYSIESEVYYADGYPVKLTVVEHLQ